MKEEMNHSVGSAVETEQPARKPRAYKIAIAATVGFTVAIILLAVGVQILVLTDPTWLGGLHGIALGFVVVSLLSALFFGVGGVVAGILLKKFGYKRVALVTTFSTLALIGVLGWMEVFSMPRILAIVPLIAAFYLFEYLFNHPRLSLKVSVPIAVGVLLISLMGWQ